MEYASAAASAGRACASARGWNSACITSRQASVGASGISEHATHLRGGHEERDTLDRMVHFGLRYIERQRRTRRSRAEGDANGPRLVAAVANQGFTKRRHVLGVERHVHHHVAARHTAGLAAGHGLAPLEESPPRPAIVCSAISPTVVSCPAFVAPRAARAMSA